MIASCMPHPYCSVLSPSFHPSSILVTGNKVRLPHDRDYAIVEMVSSCGVQLGVYFGNIAPVLDTWNYYSFFGIS
mgnify:FL=1